MGDETMRVVESNYSFSRDQVSGFMKDLASTILTGKVEISGEEIEIPEHLEVEYEFKEKKGQKKLEVEIKW